MKQFWKEFFLRGLLACGGGPLVLAIIYGILGLTENATSLRPGAVCMGIVSITLLAFIVAGMTAIYQIEKLPLPMAIMLHGGVLYLAYMLIYLLNGWLKNARTPILVFTCVFLVGYAMIWGIIYFFTKAKAKKLNHILKNQFNQNNA